MKQMLSPSQSATLIAKGIMSGQGMWPNIDVMVDSDEMTVDKLLNQIEERI